MLQPLNFTLFALSATPLQTAILQFTKPTLFLLDAFSTKYEQGQLSKDCTVFEFSLPEKDDLLYVDGLRGARLLRHRKLWPFRILPAALNLQLMRYPEKERSGISRIKPIQSCLSGGYFKLQAFVLEKEIQKFPNGIRTLINDDESRKWMASYDLIRCCNYIPDEWRLIRPLSELREKQKLEI